MEGCEYDGRFRRGGNGIIEMGLGMMEGLEMRVKRDGSFEEG